jgi:hypothetical protein
MTKAWGGVRNPAIDEELFPAIGGKYVREMTDQELKRTLTEHVAHALQFDTAIVRLHSRGYAVHPRIEELYRGQNLSWKYVQTCIEELQRRHVSAMYLPLYELLNRRSKW